MRIEQHDEMGGAVLNCAVRYALGRASYMPGLVIDEIRPRLDNLTEKTLWCMERDIAEWASEVGNQENLYWSEWQAFLEVIRRQLKKRKAEAGPEQDDRLDFMIFSKRIALAKLFEEWAMKTMSPKRRLAWSRSCTDLGCWMCKPSSGSLKRTEKVKSSGPVDFYWPEVGSLRAMPLGERKMSLRFFPSGKAIAEGLVMASGGLKAGMDKLDCGGRR